LTGLTASSSESLSITRFADLVGLTGESSTTGDPFVLFRGDFLDYTGIYM